MAFLGTIAIASSAQLRRPMVVDDLFSLQTLGEIRMSADGASIAVVVQRAWSDPETFRPYGMFGNDHADIWMLSADGGPARNITQGAKDASGYWNPVWSSDNQRLALLSTAGGNNVRAYVWERSSGRLRRLSERGVDLRAGTNATGTWNPIQWLDTRQLLVSVLPEGEQPSEFRARRQTQRTASEAWKKAAQGREPTSSVLEGGISRGQVERTAQLLLIDALTGRSQVLAQGGIKHVLLSPDRKHVAVIAQSHTPAPGAGKPLAPASAAPSRLGITSLERNAGMRWVEGIFNPVVGFGTHPHRWSPRGTALAVLASERPQAGSAEAVVVVSPADLSIRRVAGNLSPSAIAWSDDEQLLVRARPPGEGERTDWWRVPLRAGEPRNITSALTTVPSQLARTRHPGEVIGVADGELWSIDATNGTTRNLTATLGSRISGLVWPGEEERATSPVTSTIVRVRDGDTFAFHRLDISGSGAEVTNLPHPARATVLAGYDSRRNLAVFAAAQDPDGSFLWTAAGGTSSFSERMALNRHLAAIADSERVLVDYRSADGKELKGLLLLPVGYEKGKRYPLVTWVYPGLVIQETTTSFWVNKNQAHQDNLHILTGRGYAVLIPSMPSGGVPREPYEEFPAGVLPAVDRVIALGVADADRVALVGQSAGGFATFGLITQTTRFKAAVAISGYANLASNYGTFPGEERYTERVDEKLVQARFSEGSVIGLGAPPWQDSARYVRNSPIFFLDRVQTPLLILHGDIDYVPMQQAEEVFTGLYRLGKRVRFVRYWGESHGTDSAANIRDRWQQMLGWLNTYLGEATH